MCVCICFLPAHILKQKGLSVFRIEKAFYFWYPMSLLCDFQIHINCLHTFYVNEEVLSAYCGRLKKIIEQERRRSQINYSGIEIGDFPGGPYGFELITRFCYSNNSITITVANVSLLHCCAVFLGMTEKISTNNLLKQTETFLEGMFDWSWRDLLVCLKSCESFFDSADSSGLIDKLIYGVVAKIAQNSDIATSSSSSSSPETHRSFRVSSSSFKNTPEALKPSSSSRAWWFDDVSILPPKIIDRLIQSLGAYGTDNNSLILTRFLLHYLKVVSALQGKKNTTTLEFGGLADTAVHGVVLVGSKVFSCRSLFWVLRIVSGFGLSKEYRLGLERLIGEMLDEATLDDLLVSGHDRGGVYDVNLVIRLIRVFSKSEGVSLQKLKKVGRLIDKYLGEISPDQNLKMSKFLGVAESLPDSARDCYDGAYRAIDIYLESHPTLSFEERSRLCRCLNYEKLSLEACKELAKNPKIPPRVAIQALMSQQSKALTGEEFAISGSPTSTTASAGDHFHQSHFHSKSHSQMIVYNKGSAPGVDEDILAEDSSFDTKLNLQRMQWRVVELEKLCREMKGQMSRMVKNNNVLSSSTPSHGRTLPRLC